MLTIEDFLKVEGNSYTRDKLLKAIENLKKSEKEEFIFNIYSIIIDKENNEVVISNDIDPVDFPSSTFTLADFYSALDDFESK